mgnify:CR=1 FL=1
MLTIAPSIPKQWDGYQFHIVYEDEIICVDVKKDYVSLHTVGGREICLSIYGENRNQRTATDICDSCIKEVSNAGLDN